MSRDRSTEKPPFELIEEAFHLVRLAPLSALAVYYLGSLPFMLGLLYFWSDMSRSAFAQERLWPGVIVLTGLFVWMKAWQSVYARVLLDRLCGSSGGDGLLRNFGRAAVMQAIVQPAGLFLLPLALLLMFPFGWTYGFFTSATVLLGTANPDLRTALARSWRQAFLWPLQGHYLITLFFLFGAFVFVNLFTALLGVPFLLKTLLGIESVFTRSPWAAMNGTLLAAQVALTYLCLDPVVKAAWVLRCFLGESLRSGEDLRAELRAVRAARAQRDPAFADAAGAPDVTARPGSSPLAARATSVARLVALTAMAAPLALALVLVLAPARSVAAEEAAAGGDRAPASSGPVAPEPLDRAIERTIQKREYSWRLPPGPKEKPAGTGKSTTERIAAYLEDAVKAVGRWVEDALKWLFGKMRPTTTTPAGGGKGVASVMEVALILLLALLLGVILWLLFRLWQGRSLSPAVAAEPAAAVPDLADENVTAEELPEDGWVRLARELMEKGEFRLALRAFYLSGLSHLGERNLVTLARFKSNRDYERELLRRAHALAGLPERFADSVNLFEEVWYGSHPATPERLARMQENLQGLKGGA